MNLARNSKTIMQPSLKLKPTHKAIRDYYDGLQTMKQTGTLHEGAVAPMFANLLRHLHGFEFRTVETACSGLI